MGKLDDLLYLIFMTVLFASLIAAALLVIRAVWRAYWAERRRIAEIMSKRT